MGRLRVEVRTKKPDHRKNHHNAILSQKGRLQLLTQQLEHGRSTAELHAENRISLGCAHRCRLGTVRGGGGQRLLPIERMFARPRGGGMIRSNCSWLWISGTSACTSGASPGCCGHPSSPSTRSCTSSDSAVYETWSPNRRCSVKNGRGRAI
jgi:hypothetical protein